MKQILIFGLILFSAMRLSAQSSLNQYKYVIIPENYDFVKGNDAYQLNSLTKFLFNKYGFTAFVSNEKFPEDLIANGCIGLRANVKKKSGLFLTKLFVELKDCSGKKVYTSPEGTSREKEFKKSYQEALRNVFKHIQKLNHVYKEESAVTIKNKTLQSKEVLVTEKTKEDLIKVKEEVEKNISSGATEKAMIYTLNDIGFTLKKNKEDYELYKNQGENANFIGKIYKSSKENSYVVKAADLSGVGYFDSFGNFIVERVNPATDALIMDTFARQ